MQTYFHLWEKVAYITLAYIQTNMVDPTRTLHSAVIALRVFEGHQLPYCNKDWTLWWNRSSACQLIYLQLMRIFLWIKVNILPKFLYWKIKITKQSKTSLTKKCFIFIIVSVDDLIWKYCCWPSIRVITSWI